MTFYAKSPLSDGRQPTTAEHCAAVAALAEQYGGIFGCGTQARLAGQLHDFGKYSKRFQDVLRGTRHHVDHAICGASFLWRIVGNDRACRRYIPVLEAINGHHDGLLEMALLK